MESETTEPEPAPKRPPMRSRQRFNLLLALASSVVCAATLEGLGRLAERRWPPPQPAAYIWDWRVEWGGDFPVFEPPGAAWPRQPVNGDGFRDRWRTVEALPGTRRVVCLGDSVTLGAGIEADEAFPQVLERMLRARGRRVEVFNAGMLGWSTRQERIAYERLLRRYRPDTVLLGVCLNDIPEIHNNLARPPAWLAALHRRSALARLAIGGHRREIQRVEQLFAHPEAALTRAALDRFFTEVSALRAAVRADGAELALLVFPFRFQVLADAPPPSVQRAIAGFCARESLRCLDLLPRLAALGEGAFVDYDHLSPQGARAVSEEVLAAGLVPEPAGEGGTGAPTGGGGHARSPSGALSHHDPAVRAEAVERLAAAAPSSAAAVPLLMAALADPVAGVRWRAADALAGLPGDPTHVPALTRALESGDEYVRSFAAWALGELGPAAGQAAPALLRVLRAERLQGRRSGAAAALARVAPRQAALALLAELEAPEAARRAEAAAALAHLGLMARPAAPALARALADGDAEVRAQAAAALGRLGPSGRGAVPALLGLTGDADPRVRGEAVTALSLLAPEDQRVGDALVRALRDRKPVVRARAVSGLAARGSAARDAATRMAALLEDRDREVQIAAARSLGALGTIARQALPALEKAARDDPRPRVREEARAALARVNGGGQR